MNRTSELQSFIGRAWNDTTKQSIEKSFNPYKVMVCDESYFYREVFITNTIRCVVSDGVITMLGFN